MSYFVGMYLRLSNDDGTRDESNSISNQREYILQYVQDQADMRVEKEYVDDGYTGTNFNRPQFKQMIEDISKGLINCIIVKDLSRLGRDYIGVGKYIERFFPENGIRFIAINDSYDSFDDRNNDDLIVPIKNIFNASYSKDISKKVKAAFKSKQKNGEFIGAFPSYGYSKNPKDLHKLVIDETAANVVREIFNMFNSGIGKIGIAKRLNMRGIPCPSEYKKMMGFNYRNCKRMDTTTYWTYSTISHILKNEMYVGNMVQNKSIRRTMHGKATILNKEDWIILEGTHEPIISKETWDIAQTLLGKRGRQIDAFSKTISLFAGFIICGDCGRAMVKRFLLKPKKDKDYCYLCGSYVNYGASICTRKEIPVGVLENAVLSKLNEELKKVDMENIIPENNRKNKAIDTSKLSNKLALVKNRKKKLFDSYADDIITKLEYEEYKELYETEESQILSQIRMIEEGSQVNEQADSWIVTILKYKEVKELTREILAEILEKIIVTETNEGINIEIKLKFDLS